MTRMARLAGYFEVEFLDHHYSLQDLIVYAVEQLIRLAGVDWPALMAERIVATQGAVRALDEAMADQVIRTGLQKGRTAAKRAFRRALPGVVRRIHAAVVAAFGAPSRELAECFPAGRMAFQNATEKELGERLAALVAALGAHASALPPGTLADAAGLRAAWAALCEDARGARGTRTTGARTRQALRRALAVELHRNVLTLSILHPGDRAKGAYYCPQEKLDGRGVGRRSAGQAKVPAAGTDGHE